MMKAIIFIFIIDVDYYYDYLGSVLFLLSLLSRSYSWFSAYWIESRSSL
jgi:hypothetical protein